MKRCSMRRLCLICKEKNVSVCLCTPSKQRRRYYAEQHDNDEPDDDGVTCPPHPPPPPPPPPHPARPPPSPGRPRSFRRVSDAVLPSYVDVCQALICHILKRNTPTFLERWVKTVGRDKITSELHRIDRRSGTSRLWHPDLTDIKGALEENLLHLYLLPTVPYWKVDPIFNEYVTAMHKQESGRYFGKNWELFDTTLRDELRPYMTDNNIVHMFKEARAVQSAVEVALCGIAVTAEDRPERQQKAKCFLLVAARMRLRLVYESKLYQLYGIAELKQKIARARYEHNVRHNPALINGIIRDAAFTWRNNCQTVEMVDEVERWGIRCGQFRARQNAEQLRLLLVHLTDIGHKNFFRGDFLPSACFELERIKFKPINLFPRLF